MSFRCTIEDYREAINNNYGPKETFLRTAVDQSFEQWPDILSCKRGKPPTKEERNIFRLRFGLGPIDETKTERNISKK